MSLILRGIKGSALTHAELDNNLVWLKGRDVVTADLVGTNLVLTKDDTTTFNVDLSSISGGNSILTGGIIYVDAVYGDDSTAIPYDLNKPYQSPLTALSVAISGDLIYVRPGSYNVGVLTPTNNLVKDGVNFYVCRGAQIFQSSGILFDDNGVATLFGVYGEGYFGTNTLKIRNASTNVDFNFLETFGGGGSAKSFDLGAGKINLKGTKLSQSGTGIYLTGTAGLTANIIEISNFGSSFASNIIVDNFSGNAIINANEIKATSPFGTACIKIEAGNTGNIFINVKKLTSTNVSAVSFQSGNLFLNGDIFHDGYGITTKGTDTGVLRFNGYIEDRGGYGCFISGAGIGVKNYIDGVFNSPSSVALKVGVAELVGMVTTDCHLEVNGNVYSPLSSGIIKEGTTTVMVLNTVKIISDTTVSFTYTSECITSTTPQDVVIVHSVKSNVDKSPNITNIVSPDGFAFNPNIL